nr:hypothetical protein BaRGS_009201 [Batillaria attramentaria]
MAAAILVLFILSLAGNIMGSFKYTAMEITDSVASITEIRTATTDFYLNNRRAFHAVHEVTFNVVIPAISLVVVIAATVVIAVGSSNHSSTTNQREAAVTRMLLVVCMIYSICTTPSVIQALLRTFVADFVGGGPYNNIFFASLVITHLLESVNCSINFIIYYTMSTRFRETLRDMVHRGDVKKRKQQVESNTRVSALSASEGIDP